MKVYGVTGWKNQGKTTLVAALVAELTGRGLVVSTVKHTHHAVDLDAPGRDSFRHRAAGAGEVVLASASRLAFLHELRGAPEWPLERILARMAPADLVLVEGYKTGDHRKIEVYRRAAANGRAPIASESASVRAIAGDPDPAPRGLPVFDPGHTAAIADFVLADAEDVPR